MTLKKGILTIEKRKSSLSQSWMANDHSRIDKYIKKNPVTA